MNKLQKALGTITLGALALAGCKQSINVCGELKQRDMKVIGRNWDEIIRPTMVFKDKNGFFISHELEVYDQFKLGDSVRINYRERYKIIFDDTNNDGRNDFLERKYIGESLIDAQLLN